MKSESLTCEKKFIKIGQIARTAIATANTIGKQIVSPDPKGWMSPDQREKIVEALRQIEKLTE